MQALQKELETYYHNKRNLLATAKGKFVLIKGDTIVDVFDTNTDAIRQGYKRLGNVPFLVKQVTEFEEILHFVSNLLGV